MSQFFFHLLSLSLREFFRVSFQHEKFIEIQAVSHILYPQIFRRKPIIYINLSLKTKLLDFFFSTHSIRNAVPFYFIIRNFDSSWKQNQLKGMWTWEHQAPPHGQVEAPGQSFLFVSLTISHRISIKFLLNFHRRWLRND